MKQNQLSSMGRKLPVVNRVIFNSSSCFSLMKKATFTLAIGLCLAGCKKNDPVNVNGIEGENKTAASVSAVIPPDFTIALLPDIQFLTDPSPEPAGEGGLEAMLTADIKWIMDNRAAENIVYVGGLGDITDNGDKASPNDQWGIVQRNFYGNQSGYAKGLETPLPGFPYGIPYGMVPGNHDQRNPDEGPLKPCAKYNATLGRAHFANTAHPYYGGSSTTANNNNHYQRFSVGVAPNKMDFMVININFDPSHAVPTVTDWAFNLCTANPNTKIIILTHYVADPGHPAEFSPQGLAIWNKMKGLANVFMFAGGHITGEGYRQDTFNGRTIRTFQTDYQSWDNGGNGYFRLMKFSAANDLITVRSYSPYLNHWLASASSTFTKAWFRSPTCVRINDFSNQGKNQLAFFNNGVWKVNGMADQTAGQAGDIPCPGDYDGDGDADKVYWRPSNATWYGLPGGVPVVYGDPNSADIPVPGDYIDGDGKFEIAIFRPANGTWYIKDKGNYVHGQNGDIPIVGDNGGDGIYDLTVYRPSTKTFLRNGGLPNVTFAGATAADIPVPGDYNGDAKANTVAIFRPSTGEWIIDGMATSVFGQAGDIPVPGDYRGEGWTQKAVYRPSTGTLYVSGGTNVVFGSLSSGDKILNLPYPIRKSFFP